MTGDDPRDGSEMAAPPAVDPAALGVGLVDAAPVWGRSTIAPPDFAGRRLSWTAWAIALTAGALIWAVIITLL